jgi:potassium efflux system protein
MDALSEWLKKEVSLVDTGALLSWLGSAVTGLLILCVTYLIYRSTTSYIDHKLTTEHPEDNAALEVYRSIARWGIFLPGGFLAIHFMGFDLYKLFTTGGLVAVAMAFALKNVSDNLIAGVIIKSEGSVKHGDILDMEGTMVRVKSTGVRATIVRTKEEMDILIPNSKFIGSHFGNYTFRDPLCRISATVGVTYSSDLKQVREVLEAAAKSIEDQSKHHAPTVWLTDFGNSSVNYKVCIWIEKPWDYLRVLSALHEAVWWGLKNAGITIAFPQLDVHFDDPPRLTP